MNDAQILMHYFIVLTTTAIVAFGLGLFVLGRNPTRPLNRLFCVLHVLIACWSFGEAMLSVSSNLSQAIFWSKFLHVGVIFIPTLFLHFAFVLLGISEHRKNIIGTAYGFSILFTSLLFNRQFLPDPVPKFQLRYAVQAGPLYYPFLTIWLLIVAYTLVEGFRACLRARGEEKNRLKYLFISMMIGFVGGAPNFLHAFNIQLYPLNPFSTYGVVIYSVILTYAVVKHRLMDINIVIRKGLLYSTLVAAITVTYLLVVLATERVFQQVMGYQSFVSTLLAAILIAIFFIPLKNHIQALLDRFFFHGTQEAMVEENQRLREELRQSEQLRAASLFAAGVAHEIKNPLTAIQTFTEHLPERYADPTFREKFCRIVTGEVEKIKGLVGNLMSFARSTPLQRRPTDLAVLLDQTLDVFNADCLKHGIRVERRYAHQGAPLYADPAQLRQAVMNIVLNSLEAMERGGLLTVETASTPEATLIRVIDTGRGIPPQEIPRVTEPFFSTKTQGTGLGLSIVQGIVANHGGRLLIASRPGEGTTVTIELPARGSE